METNNENGSLAIEFGAGTAVSVPYKSLNLLAQTRSHYDQDALDELAQSMLVADEDGIVTGLRLLQRPEFAAFDSVDTAERFLYDFNLYHGTTYSPEDLRWVDGVARVAIFGHSRTKAFAMAAERAGFDIDLLPMEVFEQRNISFEHALVRQILENIHQRPSLEDEADAVYKYYEYRKFRHPDNQPPSIAEVARTLGFGESKVRSALRYAQMPDVVKNEAHKGRVSYSDVVNLWPLYQAHITRGESLEKSGDLKGSNIPTADSYAIDATLTDTLNIAKHRSVPTKEDIKTGRGWKRWGAREIEVYILNRLKDVQREILEPDVLMYVEAEISVRRRQAVYRGLADGAARAIEILLQYSPESIPDELRALLAPSASEPTPTGTELDGLFTD